MKKALVPLIAAMICIAVLSVWTDGFRAFTVFSYTLNKAGTMPRAFPDMELINQEGNSFRILDTKKFVLINFVYLNCPDVCHKVSNRLEKIYHLIPSDYFIKDLAFVTVSFDPERDDINRIKRYRQLFDKDDISGWDFAIPSQTHGKDLNRYLKETGIWAAPAPVSGMINHSVYIFLISPDNRVVATFDPARESDRTISEKIKSIVGQNEVSL